MLDNWQRMLRFIKNNSTRGYAILEWHEETLLKMKLNLFQLRKEVKNYVQ